jgi:hypothetical protein
MDEEQSTSTLEDEHETGTAVAVIEEEALAEQSDVRPLESVEVPITAMLTALAVATYSRPKKANGKKDDTPEFLLGVRLIAVNGEARLIGTNGHWIFVYSIPMADPPEWLRTGFTVPAHLLRERLSMIDKLGFDAATIAYQTEAPYFTLRDERELVTFKVRPLDGAMYPDEGVQSNFDKMKFVERRATDLESIVYHPTYLKGLGAIAASLGVMDVRIFATGSSTGSPSLVTFPGCDHAALILMPRTLNDEMKRLPLRTTVLDAAVAGSVAALRAHRTRWERKLDKAASDRSRQTIERKMADYDVRIAALLPPVPALEAPEDIEPGSAEEREVDLEIHEPDAPVGLADPKAFQERLKAKKEQGSEEAQREVAVVRAKLKGKKRDEAIMRWTADLNAAFSRENGGMTIGQLADGLPVEAWYDAGLSASDAAARCVDWIIKEQPEEPEEAAE